MSYTSTLTSSEIQQNVKRMYLRLLRSTKTISNIKQRIETQNQIKESFRQNKSIDNKQVIDDMLLKAQSSLSYIKIISTKVKSESPNGITRIVFNNKEMNENQTNERKPISNWTGTNMDPDAVSRHYHGLKRAGFQNNSHAKGIF